MHYIHKNKGTCSSSIQFDLEDGIVHNIKFKSGCDGILKGIALLAEGRDAREVAQLITGVRCGSRSTSCPDQLAHAILDALRNEEEASGEVDTDRQTEAVPLTLTEIDLDKEDVSASSETDILLKKAARQ